MTGAPDEMPLQVYEELLAEYRASHPELPADTDPWVTDPPRSPIPPHPSLLPGGWTPAPAPEQAGWFEASPTTEFTKPDGTTYARVDPEQFPLFDQVDSTTIIDDEVPE